MEQKALLYGALPQGFTVTAHSGCMGTEDNSLESITVGFENADIAEVDVVFAADGTPVLFHGLTPPADAVPLAKAFELLAKNPGKRMNLDLKRFQHTAEVQALAEQYGVLDRVFFTGVRQNKVRVVRKGAPGIPYYLNCNIVPLLKNSRRYAAHLVRKVRSCGAVGLNCDFINTTPTIVTAMRRAGFLVSLWTVKTEAQAETVLRLAPDNLTTRIPDVVHNVMKQLL
ncbi:MAG: glycerophosphodiester phosphodiesterase [Clostridia bacterium]|nr:glycerophosphodiester phosphodiesterase [Clostridia bacterium]